MPSLPHKPGWICCIWRHLFWMSNCHSCWVTWRSMPLFCQPKTEEWTKTPSFQSPCLCLSSFCRPIRFFLWAWVPIKGYVVCQMLPTFKVRNSAGETLQISQYLLEFHSISPTCKPPVNFLLGCLYKQFLGDCGLSNIHHTENSGRFQKVTTPPVPFFYGKPPVVFNQRYLLGAGPRPMWAQNLLHLGAAKEKVVKMIGLNVLPCWELTYCWWKKSM